MKNTRIKKLCRLALLCALAIALSALEGIFAPLLPPGAKAGLSNVIVMFAAMTAGFPATLAIVLFKATFALITRGAVSFLLSLAGGLGSAILLYLLFRFSRRLGLFGISVLGALFHSLLQIAVSALLYGTAVFAYAPLLLALSVPSGLITAAALRAADYFIARKTSERSCFNERSL